MTGGRTTRWLIAACLGLSAPAFAQDEGAPADRPVPASDAAADERQTFTQAEFDELLAPIALYPDPLLTQVLMASTYPLEIVQADRWVKANPKLQGDELATALGEQRWDPSVKSLVNSPTVLTMMSDKLEWTIRLGDAFIGQEKQVMDTVQDLRARAQAAGNLKDTPQQRVVVQDAPRNVLQDDVPPPPVQQVVREKVIVIEPAEPEVIYVPVYDPIVTYGTWWHPYHRPFYYCPPAYPAYYSGVSFGISFHYGPAWGYAWGYPDWHHGHCHVDVHRHSDYNHHVDRRRYKVQYDRHSDQFHADRGTWVHDPSHRHHVSYRGAAAERFAGYQNRNYNRVTDRNYIVNKDGNFIRPTERNFVTNKDGNFIPGQTPSDTRRRTDAFDDHPGSTNVTSSANPSRQTDSQRQREDTDRVKIRRENNTIRPRIERSVTPRPAESQVAARQTSSDARPTRQTVKTDETPTASDTVQPRESSRETTKAREIGPGRQTPTLRTTPQIRDTTRARDVTITRSASPTREPTRIRAESSNRSSSSLSRSSASVRSSGGSGGVSVSASPRPQSVRSAPAPSSSSPRPTITRSYSSSDSARSSSAPQGSRGDGQRSR
jgi:hypothetical protein